MQTDLRDIFQDPYSATVASLKGRVYRASMLLRDLPVAPIFFIQTPAVGKILRSISLSGTGVGGMESFYVYGATAVGATQETYNGRNMDGTLELISTSPVLKVASITGGELVPMGIVQTPTATAQRASSGIADIGIRGTYDNAHPAMFKFDILSAGTKLHVTWIWEEL